MSDALQKIADQYVSKEKFSGIEWRVEKNQSCLFQGQAGYADFEKKTPIPENAIYRIYSMTKPIISVLALQLIEQGSFSLTDPLSDYDERFSAMTVLHANGEIEPANTLITIEHLLTHRAGFTYEFIMGCHVSPYYREAEIMGDAERDLNGMMDALCELPLAFHPGSAWRYSVSTDVLAHIIQRATGESIQVLLEKMIFKPLKMHDTKYNLAQKDLPRLMSMYGISDLQSVPPIIPPKHILSPMEVSDKHPTVSHKFCRGGYGLFSTMNDYAAFVRMLLNGKAPSGEVVLSPKTLELMHPNRVPQNELPLRISYWPLAGYGWNLIGRVMLDPSAAIAATNLDEFGWAGAASTFFWVDPKEQLTGVIMTQFIGSGVPLIEDLQNAVYQELKKS